MSMRKRKKVQILSREELMLRRWDFRLVPSERSLEAVGESVDLHIIGRSKAFDLFPRTHKGKNRCILREKHALINSRERTRIWLHTWHQSGAIEPCGDSRVDVKGKIGIAVKRLEIKGFKTKGSIFECCFWSFFFLSVETYRKAENGRVVATLLI